MRITDIPPATERAIVRDYVATGLSLSEIAAKHGISVNMLTKIRKQNGVHRYQTRKMKSSAAKLRLDARPEPQLWRCPFCHGPSTDQEGHSGCISRNQPKGVAA